MLSHKRIRRKGKISLTKYFQEFKAGDPVAVSQELSIPFPYPKKLQGRTGRVIDKRGKHYYVEIKDINMKKRYVISPVHLIKIKEHVK